jgi:hypothetical protein
MDKPSKPTDPGAVVIKADDEIAKGRFANVTHVGSNLESFVFDFAFVQGKQGFLLSRVLMSPQHAKRFQAALSETIAKHEAHHGEIPMGPTLQ